MSDSVTCTYSTDCLTPCKTLQYYVSAAAKPDELVIPSSVTQVGLAAKCERFKQNHFTLTIASEARAHLEFDSESRLPAANLTAGSNLFDVMGQFIDLKAGYSFTSSC